MKGRKNKHKRHTNGLFLPPFCCKMDVTEAGRMTEYKLGKVAGLHLSAAPGALAGSILLFLALLVVAIGILWLSISESILGSLAAIVLHWVAAFAHQLGHAWAAHQTGYPMSGIRFGAMGLLGTSQYPSDEPALPAAIHIRRALGGPSGSLFVSIVAAILALLLRNSGGVPFWLAVFFLLDNFLVFTLGSLLPLGFTDGSTLLEWWSKR
jgi:hypothetical protein